MVLEKITYGNQFHSRCGFGTIDNTCLSAAATAAVQPVSPPPITTTSYSDISRISRLTPPSLCIMLTPLLLRVLRLWLPPHLLLSSRRHARYCYTPRYS